jgi:hypothetical protein
MEAGRHGLVHVVASACVKTRNRMLNATLSQRFEEDCGWPWGYVTSICGRWMLNITDERFPPNSPDIFEFKLMISAHTYKENAEGVIRSSARVLL